MKRALTIIPLSIAAVAAAISIWNSTSRPLENSSTAAPLEKSSVPVVTSDVPKPSRAEPAYVHPESHEARDEDPSENIHALPADLDGLKARIDEIDASISSSGLIESANKSELSPDARMRLAALLRERDLLSVQKARLVAEQLSDDLITTESY